MRAPKREDQGRNHLLRRVSGDKRYQIARDNDDTTLISPSMDLNAACMIKYTTTSTSMTTSGNRRSSSSSHKTVVDTVRKGPWKPEEDEVLLKHVSKYGPRDWSSLRSKGLLLRTGKSCRLRWVNKLRPNLKNGCKFSPEEERIVIELQAQFGNKWAMIATHLQGRTDNDVKNFWSSRQKRLARLLLNSPTNIPSSSSSSYCSNNNNNQMRTRPQRLPKQQQPFKDTVSSQAAPATAIAKCNSTDHIMMEESTSNPLVATGEFPMILPVSFSSINLDIPVDHRTTTLPSVNNQFTPFENHNYSFIDSKLQGLLLPNFPNLEQQPPPPQFDDDQFHLFYDPNNKHIQLQQPHLDVHSNYLDDNGLMQIPLLDHHLPCFCPSREYATNLGEVDDDDEKIIMGVGRDDELSQILHHNHRRHMEPDTFFDDLPSDILDQIEALPSPLPPPPPS